MAKETITKIMYFFIILSLSSSISASRNGTLKVLGGEEAKVITKQILHRMQLD